MHDVETIFHIAYVLTASRIFFRNMIDAFHGHYLYYRKDFQMLLTFKEGHT